MLKIVICDDNQEYLNYLADLLLSTFDNVNINAQIVCKATSPNEVDDFLKTDTANVFFLDISFKNEPQGIALASRIRESNPNLYIIFISERSDLVFDSFCVHPYEFLKKPASLDAVKNCIKSIYLDYKIKNEHKLLDSKISLKSGNTTHYISKEELILIERLGTRTILHTANKQISTYSSLEYFEKILENNPEFIRCHKSYIANRQYISQINHSTKEIVFSTGHICYIGNKFKSGVL